MRLKHRALSAHTVNVRAFASYYAQTNSSPSYDGIRNAGIAAP